jgi:DNA-directed RNA polymerase
MVNCVNSVQFKINKNVLEFILANNNLYNFFIDSNYIHPLTLKSKLTKAEGLELEEFYNQRFKEQNILGLATLFRVVPSFYLPVRLDYRGRLYCISEYLNYQGIELAKSLLLFSKEEKVYLDDEKY